MGRLPKSENLRVATVFVAKLWRMQPSRFICAVSISVFNGLLGGCGILLLLPLLDTLNQQEKSASHGVSRLIENLLQSAGITPRLEVMLVLFLAVIGSQVWLQRRLTINNAKLRLEFGRSLRNRMFQSITQASWGFFIGQRVSDFIHALSQDLNRVSHGTLSLLGLFSTSVLVSINFGLSLLVSPWLSLIVVGATLLLAPFLLKLNRLASQTGSDYTKQSKSFFHQIEQQLAGMKEIKTLGAESSQLAAFEELTQSMNDVELQYTRANNSATMMFTLGSAVLLSGLLILAVRVFQLPTSELFVLVLIFGRLAPQFRQLNNQYQGLLHTLASFKSAMQMQASLDEDRDSSAAEASESVDKQQIELPDTDHRLAAMELRGIFFRYDIANEQACENLWALQDISLKILTGQTTAIVGPSGSGKSTLANLLLGLLLPSKGQLLIDGEPAHSDNLAVWRKRIGYVPQETFLLHDSIKANLLLANSDADNEAIQAAIEAASASDFINQLPEGIETIMGDRGVRLSGGERQRIALARALLRQPKILILDEATSSLDSENQNRILGAIEQMHGKLTIVMIAHRLATVRNADQIVVMEQGKIVESGSHEELTSNSDGVFSSYLHADSRHEESDGRSRLD